MRLVCDVEDVVPDVGAGGHEVHGGLVVLVPDEMVSTGQLQERLLERLDGGVHDLGALREAPHLLVLDTRCNGNIFNTMINRLKVEFIPSSITPDFSPGRFSQSRGVGLRLLAHSLSMEEILNAVVEELLEQLLRIAIAVAGPLPS